MSDGEDTPDNTSDIWINPDDDDYPAMFDPFLECAPDLSRGRYDVENQVFVAGSRQIELPEELKSQANQMVENDQDPNPTLKQALEELVQKDAPQTIDDAFPKHIFQELDDQIVFFPDACFAAPYLRSKQKCMQKDLKGYIVIPASFSTRLRSRKANHAKLTPCMYYPQHALNLAPLL